MITVYMTEVAALDIFGTGTFNTPLPITSNNLSLSIGGAGDITINGTANSLNVSVIGAGNIRTFELATAQAEVSIAGSGNVEVNVSDELNVQIDGSGNVRYRGTPEVTSSIAGSGTVRQDG